MRKWGVMLGVLALLSLGQLARAEEEKPPLPDVVESGAKLVVGEADKNDFYILGQNEPSPVKPKPAAPVAPAAKVKASSKATPPPRIVIVHPDVTPKFTPIVSIQSPNQLKLSPAPEENKLKAGINVSERKADEPAAEKETLKSPPEFPAASLTPKPPKTQAKPQNKISVKKITATAPRKRLTGKLRAVPVKKPVPRYSFASYHPPKAVMPPPSRHPLHRTAARKHKPSVVFSSYHVPFKPVIKPYVPDGWKQSKPYQAVMKTHR